MKSIIRQHNQIHAGEIGGEKRQHPQRRGFVPPVAERVKACGGTHRDWRRRERKRREHRGGSSRRCQEVPKPRLSVWGAESVNRCHSAATRPTMMSGGSRHRPDWSPKSSGLPRCPRPLSRPERPRTKVRHRPAFSLPTSGLDSESVVGTEKPLTIGSGGFSGSFKKHKSGSHSIKNGPKERLRGRDWSGT